MLAIIQDLRQWVQGHVLADIEKRMTQPRVSPPNDER
jgi:hypothetical protein